MATEPGLREGVSAEGARFMDARSGDTLPQAARTALRGRSLPRALDHSRGTDTGTENWRIARSAISSPMASEAVAAGLGALST